jgi:hypothetical protein
MSSEEMDEKFQRDLITLAKLAAVQTSPPFNTKMILGGLAGLSVTAIQTAIILGSSREERVRAMISLIRAAYELGKSNDALGFDVSQYLDTEAQELLSRVRFE